MGRGIGWMVASPVQVPRMGKGGMEGLESCKIGLHRRLYFRMKQAKTRHSMIAVDLWSRSRTISKNPGSIIT